MDNGLKKWLWAFALISIFLTMTIYSPAVPLNWVTRGLYFFKSNAFIAGLLLYIERDVTNDIKPILHAVMAHCASLAIYEYLIVFLENSLYVSAITNPIASLGVILIPVGVYFISKMFNTRDENNNKKRRNQGKYSRVFTRISSKIRKWF